MNTVNFVIDLIICAATYMVLDSMLVPFVIVRDEKHKKQIMITVFIILLQLLFGFDAKFCIMNIIWLLLI